MRVMPTSFHDGTQTMRNEDARACLVLQKSIDVAHQLCLSVRIQSRCLREDVSSGTREILRVGTHRLVEEQNWGVLQEHPGHRHTLLFSARKHQSSFADLCRVLLW